MTVLGHLILFFSCNFAGFLINSDRRNAFGIFLLIALPFVGVYFLGWWALGTSIVGLIFGGKLFWSSTTSQSGKSEE